MFFDHLVFLVWDRIMRTVLFTVNYGKVVKVGKVYKVASGSIIWVDHLDCNVQEAPEGEMPLTD